MCDCPCKSTQRWWVLQSLPMRMAWQSTQILQRQSTSFWQTTPQSWPRWRLWALRRSLPNIPGSLLQGTLSRCHPSNNSPSQCSKPCFRLAHSTQVVEAVRARIIGDAGMEDGVEPCLLADYMRISGAVPATPSHIVLFGGGNTQLPLGQGGVQQEQNPDFSNVYKWHNN